VFQNFDGNAGDCFVKIIKYSSGQRRGEDNIWTLISTTLSWVRGQEFLCLA